MLSPQEFLAAAQAVDLHRLLTADTDVNPVDIRETSEMMRNVRALYPGAAKFVSDISQELRDTALAQGKPERQALMFGAGALAGGMVLLHVLGLEAQNQELGFEEPPEPDADHTTHTDTEDGEQGSY